MKENAIIFGGWLTGVSLVTVHEFLAIFVLGLDAAYVIWKWRRKSKQKINN